MRTGRPKTQLTLAPPERKTLERWARRPKTAQTLAQRAWPVPKASSTRPWPSG